MIIEEGQITNWELEHAQWLPFEVIIQIGSWSMHNDCLFETDAFKMFVMHRSIMNHFGTITRTLFGLDTLLVLLLVILPRSQLQQDYVPH